MSDPQTTAQQVIAWAVESICGDGNADPQRVACNVIADLSAAGFVVMRYREVPNEPFDLSELQS